MKPKRLLIIGAGREQIPAYELARQKGLLVVGTDRDPNAPAFAHADESLLASTRDPQETVDVVARYAANHPVDGVMTIANDVPLTVASVAQRLGLPGISVQAAQRAADKRLMKEAFAREGIPCPSGVIACNVGQLSEAMVRFRPPCILKPSDGRGSRGVLYIDNSTDLNWAWNHALRHSENKALLVEEFIPGPQLSVEGVFVDGRYHAIAFADRNYENLNLTRPFIVEDGGIIPSRFDDATLGRIGAVIEQGAIALGIHWGSVKGDIVLREGEPVIIELAARLSGNYLATHHIPMAYGVDIVSAVIDLALGLAVDARALVPKHKRFLGVRYFFPPAGKVREIRGVERVRQREYIKMLDIFLTPGSTQGTIDNHGARAGTIICEAPTYALAKERVEKCVADIEFVREAF